MYIKKEQRRERGKEEKERAEVPPSHTHLIEGAPIRRSFQRELASVSLPQARTHPQTHTQLTRTLPDQAEGGSYTYVDKYGVSIPVSDEQIRKLDDELNRDQEKHGVNFYHRPQWTANSPAANMQWKLFCKKAQNKALTSQVLDLAQCDTCGCRLDSAIMKELRRLLAKSVVLTSEQLQLYALIKEFRAVIYLATEVDLPWHIWDEVRKSAYVIRSHKWHRTCCFTCHQVKRYRHATAQRVANNLLHNQ